MSIGRRRFAELTELASAIEQLTATVDRMAEDVNLYRSDARWRSRVLFGAIVAATLGTGSIMVIGLLWL